MHLTRQNFRSSLVAFSLAAMLAILGPGVASAAPSDAGQESAALLQCQIQAFLQFQSNASVTYSALGDDCTAGFVGTITVRLDGPGVSPGGTLEGVCTASGCSTASATVPCMDGQGYSGLAELFDSAGNSINTGSTFGTCQHCGSAAVASEAGACDDQFVAAPPR